MSKQHLLILAQQEFFYQKMQWCRGVTLFEGVANFLHNNYYSLLRSDQSLFVKMVKTNFLLLSFSCNSLIDSFSPQRGCDNIINRCLNCSKAELAVDSSCPIFKFYQKQINCIRIDYINYTIKMEQEDFEKGKQNRKYFLITNKSQSKSLHFSKNGKLPVIIQQHQEGDYDQNQNSSQKYIKYPLAQKKLNIFENANSLCNTLFGEKFSLDSKPYYQVGYNELRKIQKKLTRKKTIRKMTRAQSLVSNMSNRSSNHPSNTTNKEQIIVMDDIINEILITHQPKVVDKKVSRLLKSQSNLKLYQQRWQEEKSKYPRILGDCDNYRRKIQERNFYQQKALKQNVNKIGKQWQITLRNNKTMQNLLVLPGMNCMKGGLKVGSKSKYNSEIKWGEKYSTYAFTKLPEIQSQNVQILYKKNIGNVTIIRN